MVTEVGSEKSVAQLGQERLDQMMRGNQFSFGLGGRMKILSGNIEKK